MTAFTIIHQEEEDCRQLTHEITGHACKVLLLLFTHFHLFCCLHHLKLIFFDFFKKTFPAIKISHFKRNLKL